MPKPRIGYWYYFCCEKDLQQIRSKEDLKEVKRNVDPEEPFCYKVFKTRIEALKDLEVI